MRKQLILLFLLLVVMSISACELKDVFSETVSQTASPEPQKTEKTAEYVQSQATTDKNDNTAVTEERMEQKNEMILSVNGTPLNVSWENRDTVDELIAYAQNENIVVDTTLYGGFEQVGNLPQDFLRNDVQMTTAPGDIVLYSGNQLVLFFGSNSWSYTKLGHMEGLSKQELSELLGADSAVIEIKIN
jgi:hypothetical protein